MLAHHFTEDSATYESSDDPYSGLLAYCATPLENGYNPIEFLMGSKLRTTISTIQKQFLPNDSGSNWTLFQKVYHSVLLVQKLKHFKTAQNTNLVRKMYVVVNWTVLLGLL